MSDREIVFVDGEQSPIEQIICDVLSDFEELGVDPVRLLYIVYDEDGNVRNLSMTTHDRFYAAAQHLALKNNIKVFINSSSGRIKPVSEEVVVVKSPLGEEQ